MHSSVFQFLVLSSPVGFTKSNRTFYKFSCKSICTNKAKELLDETCDSGQTMSVSVNYLEREEYTWLIVLRIGC